MKFDFRYTIHCDDTYPAGTVPGNQIRYVGDQPGEHMPLRMVEQIGNGLMNALAQVMAALSDNEKHVDKWTEDFIPSRLKPLIMKAMKQRQAEGKTSYRWDVVKSDRVDIHELIELFSGSGKTQR
jgi:hypothetical protein